MNRTGKIMIVAAALAGLAACNQTATETATPAANDQAAAMNDSAMMNDPANPYAASEMKMHDAMMAAKGADVSETWARKMIEHHRGAVEMSQLLLEREPGSRYAEMARMTATKQTKEIADLEAMLRTSGPAPAAQ